MTTKGAILMQTPATVRGWLMDELRKNLKIMGYLVSTVSHTDATTYRDNGTGWTALEVLCHMRDFETVFYERVRLTVEQDNPSLPFPNPDEWAVERAYNAQDLSAVYAEWAQNRAALLTFLEGVAESDWARTGVHPRRGLMSLTDHLTLTGWHDVNHIEQFTHILAEQKTA
jgi:hypothetical protein